MERSAEAKVGLALEAAAEAVAPVEALAAAGLAFVTVLSSDTMESVPYLASFFKSFAASFLLASFYSPVSPKSLPTKSYCPIISAILLTSRAAAPWVGSAI